MPPERVISDAKRAAVRARKKRVLGKKTRDRHKEIGVVPTHPVAAAVLGAVVRSCTAGSAPPTPAGRKQVLDALRKHPAAAAGSTLFGGNLLHRLTDSTPAVACAIASASPPTPLLSHLASLCTQQDVPLLVAPELLPSLLAVQQRLHPHDPGSEKPFCIGVLQGADGAQQLRAVVESHIADKPGSS